jgi:ATP-dependent DNA helicase RecG
MRAKELIKRLNLTDECNWIEAKKGTAIDRSVMETICAYCNEPGLGDGYIILGVEQEEQSLFPSYVVSGVEQSDKIQLDVSTQCASMFNQPIRPDIEVERIGDKNVIVIHVQELADAQKPVYFKNEGLPRGAYRRIGSSDQRCTDDDLFVFYNKEDTLDSSTVKDSSLDDLSETAVQLYKNLRAKLNPFAEELQYNDTDLLHSLGCIKKESGQTYLTYAGLLLFGKRPSHRRLLPMVRVDYIRVPGNEWVEDPENRFTTIDMRGSLLEMVQRVFSQITDDLPKGFLLAEGELQATNIGLPTRVLREAIVNALIHRTYRENQPIQILRYGNRLEIKNPGFSLKPEDHLGEPGSKNRNPYIAAVFHETNLAETKGSGIRTMRALMEKANLLPPTFESDHGRNQFTTRLLLHHFLGTDDVKWLAQFEKFALNEDQKRGLIFIKEVGAIDNSAHRQLNSIDTLKASSDLRELRKKEILDQKGKGKSTYYVPSTFFTKELSVPVPDLSTLPLDLSTPPQEVNTPPSLLNTSAPSLNTPALTPDSEELAMPQELSKEIKSLGKRVNDPQKIKNLIWQLCDYKQHTALQIAKYFNKDENYFKRKYLSTMVKDGELEYTIPEMINHPQQAYIASKKNKI